MAVVIDREFKASAEALWEILGTPDRVDWVPGVTSCTFDGEVRSLDLPGAGAIKERILNHDNDARILEYSCFESPGGLESHRAKMEITVKLFEMVNKQDLGHHSETIIQTSTNGLLQGPVEKHGEDLETGMLSCRDHFRKCWNIPVVLLYHRKCSSTSLPFDLH